ncbi:MAG: acyltransferase [Lactobacillales bacterium]|jgi:surface polysaccharide O-acyltransferase-like enzyme|nr:acyltransferase [Lactobacillales bacterium]
MKKIRNGTLDFCRFIFSLLVVLLHFNITNAGNYFLNILGNSLCRLAVPFFIFISGFYFFSQTTDDNRYSEFHKILYKLTNLFINWLILYIPYTIILYMTHKDKIFELPLNFIFIFQRGCPFLPGSGFLFALVMALFVVLIINSVIHNKMICFIIYLSIYLFVCLSVYSFVIMRFIGKIPINLMAIPVIACAFYIAEKKEKISKFLTNINRLFMLLLGLSLSCIEYSICVNFKIMKINKPLLLVFTLICVVLIFLSVYNIRIIFFDKYSKEFHDLSVFIYFSHFYFVVFFRKLFLVHYIPGVAIITFLSFIFVLLLRRFQSGEIVLDLLIRGKKNIISATLERFSKYQKEY